MMKIYLHKTSTFFSPLPPVEIQTILRSYVEKVTYPAYSLYAPNRDASFFGLVDETNFSIFRTRFTTPFLITLVKGELRTHPQEERANVVLTYQLTFFAWVVFLLWHGLLLTMTVLLGYNSEANRLVALLPLLLMLGGNHLFAKTFQDDVHYFEAFFTSILQAHWQTAEVPVSHSELPVGT